MALHLLDLTLGRLEFLQVNPWKLHQSWSGIRLDERDRPFLIEKGISFVHGSLPDPVLQLSIQWQQSGRELHAFDRELARLLCEGIQPFLQQGDSLLVLFHPGQPESSRTSLLEELSSLQDLELVAGLEHGLLVLAAAAMGQSLITMGSGSWILKGNAHESTTREGFKYTAKHTSLVSMNSSTDMWLLAACLEWIAHHMQGRLLVDREDSIEFDLAPHLLVLQSRDGDKAMQLAALTPESRGSVVLNRSPGILHLGIGCDTTWSACQPVLALDLGKPGKAAGSVSLEWTISASMALEVAVRHEGSKDSIRARRQLPRPLIVSLNRIQ
jgi:hypothetical protein